MGKLCAIEMRCFYSICIVFGVAKLFANSGFQL